MTYRSSKPLLTFWQIINRSVGIRGIQSLSTFWECKYQSIEIAHNELFSFSPEKHGEKIVVTLNFSPRAINFPSRVEWKEKQIGNYHEEDRNRMRPREVMVFKVE